MRVNFIYCIVGWEAEKKCTDDYLPWDAAFRVTAPLLSVKPEGTGVLI